MQNTEKEDLSSKSLSELRRIAEHRAIVGYARLNKAELIRRLRALHHNRERKHSRWSAEFLENKTLKELKQMAEHLNISRHTELDKDELIEQLMRIQTEGESTDSRWNAESLESKTIGELREMAEYLGIPEFGRLGKAELIEQLIETHRENEKEGPSWHTKPFESQTVDELRDIVGNLGRILRRLEVPGPVRHISSGQKYVIRLAPGGRLEIELEQPVEQLGRSNPYRISPLP